MGFTYRWDRDRQTTASSRLGLRVTPTALERLAQLAVLHQVTVATLCRAAVESYVADPEPEASPAGPSPEPEKATRDLSLWLMPQTAAAVEMLAEAQQIPKTKVVRMALEALNLEAATDAEAPPTKLFSESAFRQAWPDRVNGWGMRTYGRFGG